VSKTPNKIWKFYKKPSRRPAIPKPAKVCGLCKPEFFPSPEERGYRERWSPFKGKGVGGFSKNSFLKRMKPSLLLSSKKE